ncbi:glycosyltransferase family 4 protein [soil metagenome]
MTEAQGLTERDRPVRILLLTQYFWPETFPITQLVRSLREAGSSVTVLTGPPNYPEGVTFDGYSALDVREQQHDQGFTIYRVPAIPRGKASAVRLIGNYLSFALSAAVFGPWLLRGKQFDVVFVYAPSPILQAIPAIFIARWKHASLVTWVQDLWPESLESTGFVRNRLILKAVERMVAWIYRKNDLLLGQSRAFVTPIGKLAGRVPVEYLPQPGDAAFGASVTVSEPKLRLASGFNVLFAGNLGSVQALDTLLDAAELLRGEPHVRFVLVGSGSRSRWLETEISRRGLTNVQLPGRYAPEDMVPILAQASVLLVSLIRSPIMRQTIPGKLQAYLAAGRPIIAALDGEGAQVLLESGGGLAVPAENAVALADAVLQLRNASDAERARMGEAGRRYFDRHLAADVLARQLLARLRELVLQRPS